MQLREIKNDMRETILAYGASGAGKTGALAALVDAGYRLHILDFDKKAPEVLRIFVKNPDAFVDVETPPEHHKTPSHLD